MATKTISIDVEAYKRLKSVQRDNESFSQVIKRIVRKPISAEQLAALVDEFGKTLSDDSVAAIEDAIAWRNNPLDRERMNGLLGHNRRGRSDRSKRTSKKIGRVGKAKAA
jgi:predicted CopG family antitoxin